MAVVQCFWYKRSSRTRGEGLHPKQNWRRQFAGTLSASFYYHYEDSGAMSAGSEPFTEPDCVPMLRLKAGTLSQHHCFLSYSPITCRFVKAYQHYLELRWIVTQIWWRAKSGLEMHRPHPYQKGAALWLLASRKTTNHRCVRLLLIFVNDHY